MISHEKLTEMREAEFKVWCDMKLSQVRRDVAEDYFMALQELITRREIDAVKGEEQPTPKANLVVMEKKNVG